jgi:hypothetical protein
LQPLLGVFTVPVGDILQKKQKEREDELFGMNYILSELDKILQEQGAISYNIQESII